MEWITTTSHTWTEAEVTVITGAERGVRKPPKDGVSRGVIAGGTVEKENSIKGSDNGLWVAIKLDFFWI
jgi:hypothetical protein